jgi:hypothetical protein
MHGLIPLQPEKGVKGKCTVSVAHVCQGFHHRSTFPSELLVQEVESMKQGREEYRQTVQLEGTQVWKSIGVCSVCAHTLVCVPTH